MYKYKIYIYTHVPCVCIYMYIYTYILYGCMPELANMYCLNLSRGSLGRPGPVTLSSTQ